MAGSVFNGILSLSLVQLVFDNPFVESSEHDSVSAGEVKRRGPLEHAHDDLVAAVLGDKLSEGV